MNDIRELRDRMNVSDQGIRRFAHGGGKPLIRSARALTAAASPARSVGFLNAEVEPE